ncbi:MAG TPA: DUF4097 family beta strand repeat-containing protein [Blastocatellia bacterium]|nr:DUF4097 family beta strand repeat-containing protein [Blastocatellia bacterium]
MRSTQLVAVLALVFLALSPAIADRIERSYATRGPAHLTISNVYGDITVSSWDKKTISVRARTTPPAVVQDRVNGNEIAVWVKRRIIPAGRATFQVYVPAETSLSLTNVIGKVEVSGVAGDLAVDSIDGDIRIMGARASMVDVRVTTGNIFFEGELRDGGSYSLQSVKGDIDVTVPAATAFDLNARSMSGAINLGDFVRNLTGGSRLRKGISGTHLKSGTRLTLTTFSGRVHLHKM